MSENTVSVREVHELVKEHLDPKVFDAVIGKVLVTSKTQDVHDLETIYEKHMPHPARPKGSVTLHTLESLCSYAGRHQQENETAAYCVLEGAVPKIVVVFNDHPIGEGADLIGGHRDFRAEYSFPLSEAYKRWATPQGRWIARAEFQELLERGLGDIQTPSDNAPVVQGVRYGSREMMLILSEGLEVDVEAKAVDCGKREDGTKRIAFQTEHKTRNAKGDELTVPTGFLLGIPIFAEGDPYQVPVRLRYRMSEGAVHWQYEIHGAEETKRAAMREAVKVFEEKTGIPMFFGAP